MRVDSLAEARQKRHGISASKSAKSSNTSNTIGDNCVTDTENYGRGKRNKNRNINYLRLNDGLEEPSEKLPSPKRHRSNAPIPSRLGPSRRRQAAQLKQTQPPVQSTLSSVQTKPKQPLTGVQETAENPGSAGDLSTRVLLGVQTEELPDLGSSKEVTIQDVISQSIASESQQLDEDTAKAATAGENSQDELDVADALLSLHSTIPDQTDQELDDNATLMPIGNRSQYQDVAPETINLGQEHVDGEIAHLMAMEEYDKLKSNSQTLPERIPNISSNGSIPLSGIQRVEIQNTEVEREELPLDQQPLLSVQSKSTQPSAKESASNSGGARPKTKRTLAREHRAQADTRGIQKPVAWTTTTSPQRPGVQMPSMWCK